MGGMGVGVWGLGAGTRILTSSTNMEPSPLKAPRGHRTRRRSVRLDAASFVISFLKAWNPPPTEEPRAAALLPAALLPAARCRRSGLQRRCGAHKKERAATSTGDLAGKKGARPAALRGRP